MSTIISAIILILSMLIVGFMQLTPGLFSIFYHYALGKHSVKKADDLSLNFILGAEIFITLIWALVYIPTFIIFQNSIEFFSPIFFWIMIGIFSAEAIVTLLLYYRKRGTALFISRKNANNLIDHARKANKPLDALILGFFSNFPELIFTLPLYIISAVILLNSTILPRFLFVVLFIITVTLPLFIIRSAFRTGHNLADIERFRVHTKPFLRIIIPILYILLIVAILNLGVI